MSELTVTLATCCRNRAEHVKETLLKNMEDNKQDYVRFLLVNYNSQDDLDEWARKELARYIPSGRLTYIHEKTAERFLHAHARNVAVRACTTDIFCNQDADNFTGPGLGRWLQQLYLDAEKKPYFTVYHEGAPSGDMFGRISFRTPHLIALGGYNEDLNVWGVEDYDLVSRARRAGFLPISYPKEFDVKPVAHSGTDRVGSTGFGSPKDSLEASQKLQLGKFGMNKNPNAKGQWGRATVEVNWKRTVELPLPAGETLP